jgi:DNA-binding NarL/FixJ family response regulator
MIYQVLIADDHAIIRDGLKKILNDTDDLVVAGEVGNGNAVMEKVRERDWDLIVLDISMPGRNGLELVKLIKAERPKMHILIFSMHPEEQYAVRAIRAGACGYL